MKIENLKLKISKGFTLLEMLVVIGIVSILVSLGIASYSTAQKKARDARRKSDLVSMQKVLEQCYAVSNYAYPTINGGGTTSITVDCIANGGPSLAITDPTTKTFTVTGGAGSTYNISIGLEDSTTFSISEQQ